MTTIATGVFKTLAIKKETTFGTAAGASGAQLLRRVTSTLDLQKATYKSNEIRVDQQLIDFRHGVRSVQGAISGELSGSSYSMLMESALRRDFATGATLTSTDIAAVAAVVNTSPGEFVRTSGSWISDGFRLGDVVRPSGYATTGAVNNGVNYRITGLTALTMSVGPTPTTANPSVGTEAVGAKAAGDTVTIAVAGKKTFAPLTGHTKPSYTIEHWFGDVAQSEVFTGCRTGRLQFGLPGSGLATFQAQMLGQNSTTAGSEYFTSPAAQAGTALYAAVNGFLRIGSADVGLVTGITLDINPDISLADGCVGSNIVPDIFPGILDVTGQMSVYFADGVIRDDFYNESEVSAHVVLTADNSGIGNFVSLYMGRLKFGGATKTDGTKGIMQTMPFQALRVLDATTNADPTTIVVQDSTL